MKNKNPNELHANRHHDPITPAFTSQSQSSHHPQTYRDLPAETQSNPHRAQETNSTTEPARIADCRVDKGTANILIGDSIPHAVQLDDLFPSNPCQKITFPGLTMASLTHWLKTIPPSPHVRNVVVHVGVNSCWESSITQSQWRKLLKDLKTAFPSARITMSGLLLPRSHHPLKKTISLSNDNLATVCKSEHVVFVDHTATFRTSTGAPKQAMYRTGKDHLHPSSQGIARLTQNIKQVFQTLQSRSNLSTHNYHGHQPHSVSPTGRRFLLPSPSYTQGIDRQYHPAHNHPPPHMHQKVNSSSFHQIPPYQHHSNFTVQQTNPTVINHRRLLPSYRDALISTHHHNYSRTHKISDPPENQWVFPVENARFRLRESLV